jgi:hypothetical protein
MLVLFLMSNESRKKYRRYSDMMLRVAEMQVTRLIWLALQTQLVKDMLQVLNLQGIIIFVSALRGNINKFCTLKISSSVSILMFVYDFSWYDFSGNN